MKDKIKKSNGISIFDMRRMPKLQRINTNKIKVGKFEKDNRFQNLYTSCLKGECNAALTRLSAARIVRGFYKTENNQTVHVKSQINKHDLKPFISSIMSGRRPSIFVYRNASSDNKEFLCPDDQVVYKAYSMLGIEKIPVIILDCKKDDLEESAIYIAERQTPDGVRFFIQKAQRVEFTNIGSFLGLESDVDFESSMEIIRKNVNNTLIKLKSFHSSIKEPFHYHHTLSSILFRILQSIDSIKLLVAQGFYDQTLIITRALYELSLNFYIDWLSPESIGPFLQYVSVASRKEWRELNNNIYERMKQENWDNELIKLRIKSDNRLYDLISKVSEKSILFPLNAKHSELYKYLSSFAHQDFTLTAKYAHILEKDYNDENDSNALDQIRLYIDVIVTQVVVRIQSDIGET